MQIYRKYFVATQDVALRNRLRDLNAGGLSILSILFQKIPQTKDFHKLIFPYFYFFTVPLIFLNRVIWLFANSLVAAQFSMCIVFS